MAQNITLLGASYTGVPSILLPKTGGGQASFTDVTDTTATAADVASGKYFYTADGTRTPGTSSGGSGALSVDFDLVNGAWTADKTFAEIKSAYLSGSTIVITANNLPEGTARGYYDPDDDCVYVTINYYDYSNYKEFTQWLIYNSGGIQDDGNVAYINEPTQTINISANGTYDVTNYANAEVNVSGGGGSTKNIQVNSDAKSIHTNGYTSTGLSITVSKTGTYSVSWTAWRSSSSGTMGTNLHKNSTSGTNQTGWSNTYGQHIKLTSQSYAAGDVLTLYATAGSTSRYCWVSNLIIEEE